MRQVNLWDVETATALSLYYAWQQNTGDPWEQQALEDWVEVLCKSYPEYSCRASLCGLRRHMWRTLNDTGLVAARKLTKEWRLCGRPWKEYHSGWQSCRGSWPNTRGYPCGMWLLFHTLASIAPSDLAALDVLRAVTRYINNFFECNECRRRFKELMINDLQHVQTKRDVVMLSLIHISEPTRPY